MTDITSRILSVESTGAYYGISVQYQYTIIYGCPPSVAKNNFVHVHTTSFVAMVVGTAWQMMARSRLFLAAGIAGLVSASAAAVGLPHTPSPPQRGLSAFASALSPPPLARAAAHTEVVGTSPMGRCRPLVLSGPSGVGKGTLISLLLKEKMGCLQRSP